MSRAFVDSSALLALAGGRDQYHEQALGVARRYLAAGGSWVGTTLVLSELHAILLRRAGGDPARRVISALCLDPAYQWIDASTDLVQAAVGAWLDRFRDQGFTLTDAVSFEAMRREKLTVAFAFDQHFVTAGFGLFP